MGYQFIKRNLSYTERCKLLSEKRVKEASEKNQFVSPGVWTNDIGPSEEYLDSENIPRDTIETIVLNKYDLEMLYSPPPHPHTEETEFQRARRMGRNSIIIELIKEIENANK